MFQITLLSVVFVTTALALDEPPAPYQFSYSTGDAGPAQMFREEQRSSSGHVTGRYGFVDPYGQLRVVQYDASPDEFRATGDVGPDQEAMKVARQLAEEDYREKLPFMQYWSLIAERNSQPPSPGQSEQFAKIRAQLPTKEQDWTSGQAVSSFMRSLGVDPNSLAAPPAPFSTGPTYFDTLGPVSATKPAPLPARAPAAFPSLPPRLVAYAPAQPAPVARARYTAPENSLATEKPLGSNFQFSVNHGGSAPYKYNVQY